MTGDEDESGRLAPVIPLFGARHGLPEPAPEQGPGPRHPASAALASSRGRHAGGSQPEAPRTAPLRGTPSGDPGDHIDAVDDARRHLTRRLASKQLSSREARDALREYGLSAEERDDLVQEFEDRRYLDDVTLAEHLVTSGSERRGQGRVAIARVLAQRGIPREVADEALSVLEDDDGERALAYARGKVGGLLRYDEDTAIRRLVGQLSRRGYAGGIAMNAARTAWREASRGASARRVRFEDVE
ncbi:regulatory protein RecX [uncultured Microbacterium sp.]|uniref:regulatory protein RecX n=1 Tax=uncultured Microbacterium sp. TaxID=191216 RepID=UPI0025E464CD|nr:regulatory protein RecX [uncultured Microbacterium sp.]